MFSFLEVIHQYYLIPIMITMVVLGLFAYFVMTYWLPAKKLSTQLQETLEQIQLLKKNGKASQFKQQLESFFDAAPLSAQSKVIMHG